MEVVVGFPHGSSLPRTSTAECFHLVPLLPPQPRHVATLRNWWKTAFLIQGVEFPGLQATRGGPPKPWDSVQVTKILFFPPRVCPSSGKSSFITDDNRQQHKDRVGEAPTGNFPGLRGTISAQQSLARGSSATAVSWVTMG